MPLLEYQAGSSYLHRLHPITKFTWGALIIIWLFVMFDPLHVLLVDLAVLLTAWLAAGLAPLRLIRSALKVGVAGIFIIFLQGFLYPGQTELFVVGPLQATVEGVMVGLAIALRIFGIVAASLTIAQTTNPRDIYLSLIQMGVPYKIAYGLYTALRFIPMMEYEAENIRSAQYVRGIVPQGGGAIASLRQAKNALVPLIASGLRRAEQSSVAADVRAFGLHPTRTHLHGLTTQSRGTLFVAGWALAMVAYLVLFRLDLTGAVLFNPPR